MLELLITSKIKTMILRVMLQIVIYFSYDENTAYCIKYADVSKGYLTSNTNT